MDECIFCKIIAGEIPSDKVYEDESVIVFHDLAHRAPVHVLVVPKKHIQSTLQIEKEDSELLSHMFEVIKTVAKQMGIAESGYRLMINTGEDGGQTVPHLHIHILGGTKLQE